MTEPLSARAPARIDLAGGTLDIWPICVLEDEAVTVNLAVNRFVQVRVAANPAGFILSAADLGVHEEHADRASVFRSSKLAIHRELVRYAAGPGGLEIGSRSGVPAGSGLGGSSTLVIAALAALAKLRHEELPPHVLLRRAMDIEARVIGVPTGSQDYLAAIHGGLGIVRFPAGGPVREPIAADLDAVHERLVVAWTGLPHDSAINNWEITKAYVDGDKGVRLAMGRIAAAARDVHAALVAGDLDGVGAAVEREWQARKLLAPGVTTPLIEELARTARGRGALATKVCGAGGGGCVFFWCREGARDAVAAAVGAAGGEVLDVVPVTKGVV